MMRNVVAARHQVKQESYVRNYKIFLIWPQKYISIVYYSALPLINSIIITISITTLFYNDRIFLVPWMML